MATRRPIADSTVSRKPAVRIILAPLGRHYAWGMQQSRTVWIDPRTLSPHRILLHELIHLDNPSWSETRVRRETARRWKRMTWKSKAALLRMFGQARMGHDE